jgi:hypothetical protein
MLPIRKIPCVWAALLWDGSTLPNPKGSLLEIALVQKPPTSSQANIQTMGTVESNLVATVRWNLAKMRKAAELKIPTDPSPQWPNITLGYINTFYIDINMRRGSRRECVIVKQVNTCLREGNFWNTSGIDKICTEKLHDSNLLTFFPFPAYRCASNITACSKQVTSLCRWLSSDYIHKQKKREGLH